MSFASDNPYAVLEVDNLPNSSKAKPSRPVNSLALNKGKGILKSATKTTTATKQPTVV